MAIEALAGQMTPTALGGQGKKQHHYIQEISQMTPGERDRLFKGTWGDEESQREPDNPQLALARRIVADPNLAYRLKCPDDFFTLDYKPDSKNPNDDWPSVRGIIQKAREIVAGASPQEGESDARG